MGAAGGRMAQSPSEMPGGDGGTSRRQVRLWDAVVNLGCWRTTTCWVLRGAADGRARWAGREALLLWPEALGWDAGLPGLLRVTSPPAWARPLEVRGAAGHGGDSGQRGYGLVAAVQS